MKKRITKTSENKRIYGPGVEKVGLKIWILGRKWRGGRVERRLGKVVYIKEQKKDL